MKGNKNIVVAVILTFITCGIYGLYWLACVNDDMNLLVKDDYKINGVMVIVFSLITCGIYSLYWAYKMGMKMNSLQGKNNTEFMFLILSVLGLSIVNICIMQNEINTRC